MTRVVRRLQRSLSGLVGAPLGMITEAVSVYRTGIVLLATIELTLALLPIGQAWLMRELFDTLAGRRPIIMFGVLATLLGLIGLSAIALLTMPLTQYLYSEADRRLTLKVQLSVYAKLNSFAGIGYFEDPKLHDLVQMSAQRAQHAPITAVRVTIGIARGITTTVGFITVLLATAPWLAVAAVVTVVPELIAQFGFGRQRFDLVERQTFWRRLAFYFSYVLGSTLFVRETRLWGIGPYFLSRFRDVSEKLSQQERDLQARQLRTQLFIALVSTLATSSMLAIVVIRAANGDLSIGEVTLFLASVTGTQTSVLSIVRTLAQLNETSLFYRRYKELLAMPDSVAVPSKPTRLAHLSSAIEFKDVHFAYTVNGPEVLKGLSLRLAAGSCTALVGVNGAGKSTLVKLLARFYDPTQGSITWDSINLKDVDPVDLRENVSAIFQDFARYELSVRENIGIGDVKRVDDSAAIAKAAEHSGANVIVNGLPNGYDTVLSRALGQGGVDLSGGQWQTVALARMLMRSAPLLILDEPTAALDAEAEHALYTKFRDLMGGRTALLISHRFSTVSMADYIAVLEDGRIAEYGTHRQLLGLRGSYARLYSLQVDRFANASSAR
jgi:ATP-binding cassette subfamily B protein